MDNKVGPKKERGIHMNKTLTGKPSVDRPWMQYYPPQMIEGLSIPEQTVAEYLEERCPGSAVVAMHYYGTDITWKELNEQVDKTARRTARVGIWRGRPDSDLPAFGSGVFVSAFGSRTNRCIAALPR